MVEKLNIPQMWVNKPNLIEQATNQGYILGVDLRVDGLVWDKTEQYIRDYNLPGRFWTIVRDMIINSDGNFEAVDIWAARLQGTQEDTHETK